MAEKNKVGRPKITTADFPEKWEKIVDSLYSQGASDVEIRVELDICHQTWDRLLKEDTEFAETIKKARQKCNAWWERKGRTELENDKFSSTLWYMNMKNRFGWADKQENKNEHEGELTIKWQSDADGNNPL